VPTGSSRRFPGRPAGSAGWYRGFGRGRASGSGQVGPSQPLDTATARLLGLPTAPTRQFPQEDSVLTELLKRTGYKATRYRADSATYYAEDRRIRLQGQALTEQQGVKLGGGYGAVPGGELHSGGRR
jgi:hypothetical protein